MKDIFHKCEAQVVQMETEQKIVDYVTTIKYEDIPRKAVDLMKAITLNALGAIIAGASLEGCPEAVALCKQWGGNAEATILIYGDKVSAGNAAFANSFMARAIGVDEAMLPGIHIGGSSVSTGLALAEFTGGCSGHDFLTALIAGTEVAARINFASKYDKFDPTGVCVVFATAAIAGRLLRLDKKQMWNALGHALNQSGGSWQGTVDGSVAARVLQGDASRGGIYSAQLAQKGITGPVNFLEGSYGYFNLYAQGQQDPAVASDLGERYDFYRTFLKKHPSCGTTNSTIDAVYDLMVEKGITPEEVSAIKVKVTPFTYNFTGRPFEYGQNPRIAAMYSIQYCVANALLRKSCMLRHFDESFVREPDILDLIKKIHPVADTSLDILTDIGSIMEVTMKDGSVYNKTVEFPKGTMENPLTEEEIIEKFEDCANYSKKPIARENINKILSTVLDLEKVKDVRSLVPLLISQD
jgi:2-methylcitrate dehydratase PrpD